MLKELIKSANIYQNYRKNKSGTVFLTHSVYLASNCLGNHSVLIRHSSAFTSVAYVVFDVYRTNH